MSLEVVETPVTMLELLLARSEGFGHHASWDRRLGLRLQTVLEGCPRRVFRTLLTKVDYCWERNPRHWCGLGILRTRSCRHCQNLSRLVLDRRCGPAAAAADLVVVVEELARLESELELELELVAGWLLLVE